MNINCTSLLIMLIYIETRIIYIKMLFISLIQRRQLAYTSHVHFDM